MPPTPTFALGHRAMRLLRWGVACAVLTSLAGCSTFSWSKLWPWGAKTDSTATSPAEPAAPEKPAEPAPTTFAETPPSPLPAPVVSGTAQSVPLAAATAPAAAPAAPAKTTPASKASGKPTVTAHAGSLVRGFYVNAGLFAVAANGTNAFRQLEAAGLPVFTDVVQSRTKGPLTRVRVGPYPSQVEAEQAAKDIKALGMDALVFEFAGHAASKNSKTSKKPKAAPAHGASHEASKASTTVSASAAKAETGSASAQSGKTTQSMGSASSAKAEAAKPEEKKQ